MRAPAFTPALSAEARLLLLTAGSSRTDGAIADALDRGVDWALLTRLALRERAVPVVWRRLLRVAGDALPEEATRRMLGLARVHDFRQAYLEQRLHDALAVLGSEGIDAVLLKGAAMAAAHYPSFLARPMCDVDLLVEESRAARAQALLLASGWTRSHVARADALYERHHHLPPLDDARDPHVGLEVHTALYFPGHPFRCSAARVRGGATRAVLGGIGAWVPRPVELMLHACLHLAWSHQFGTGAWRALRDIDVLAREDFDWDGFVRRARDARGSSCAFWVLRLARTLAAAPVPDEALRSLQPRTSRLTLRVVERHLTMHLFREDAPYIPVRIARALWSAAVRPWRSGHLLSRPWRWARAFEEPVAPAEPAAARQGAPRSRTRATAAYLRALLADGTPAAVGRAAEPGASPVPLDGLRHLQTAGQDARTEGVASWG